MPTRTTTRTRRRTAIATTPALSGVPNPPDPTATATPTHTSAQDALLKTLREHPGATTAELAAHASIGRSTASKILADWATAGSVSRTAGTAVGRRRPADHWSLTDTEPATATAATDEAANADAPQIGTPIDPPTPATATGTTDNTADSADKSTDAAEPHLADPVLDAPTPVVPAVDTEQPPADAKTDTAPPPGTHATPADEKTLTTRPSSAVSAASTPTPVAEPAPPAADPAPGEKTRLASGALRGMVEDFLREHPRESHGPAGIGKALQRSQGAVANALEKLVDANYAVRVQEKPKRYQFRDTTNELHAVGTAEPAAS